MTFVSILDPADRRHPDRATPEPLCFGDLNLDQLVAAVIAGREAYDLSPLYHRAAASIGTARYRQAVTADLQRPAVLAPVNGFVDTMSRIAGRLDECARLRHELQRQAVLLSTISVYCGAVATLAGELSGAAPRSAGFKAFLAHIAAYIASPGFRELQAQAESIAQDLSSIEYGLLIRGGSVVVRRQPEGESDYGKAVAATFERFRQQAPGEYGFDHPRRFPLNDVEAGILELVARLHPEPFRRLALFSQANTAFIEPAIKRWTREIQFYAAYLEFIRPLQEGGLRFTLPELLTDSKAVRLRDAFDVSLASKLRDRGASVVTNDLEMGGAERVLIVSGPNQGGKTTFARAFGQAHYLGCLGLPVPGSDARLFFYDKLFTHFEREEDIHSHRGKLEDDLVRIRRIVDGATPRSLVILNEIFASTTLRDAVLLGRRILGRLFELDLLCVCVTFMDELSTLSEKTVSLVSTVLPGPAADRTFRIVRRPADGRAYATSIAERYGLTYEALRARLPR